MDSVVDGSGCWDISDSYLSPDQLVVQFDIFWCLLGDGVDAAFVEQDVIKSALGVVGDPGEMRYVVVKVQIEVLGNYLHFWYWQIKVSSDNKVSMVVHCPQHLCQVVLASDLVVWFIVECNYCDGYSFLVLYSADECLAVPQTLLQKYYVVKTASFYEDAHSLVGRIG